VKQHLTLTSNPRLACLAAIAAVVLPGGSVVVGVLWLYRYLRVQASD
jgi:hypothetical protein